MSTSALGASQIADALEARRRLRLLTPHLNHFLGQTGRTSGQIAFTSPTRTCWANQIHGLARSVDTAKFVEVEASSTAQITS